MIYECSLGLHAIFSSKRRKARVYHCKTQYKTHVGKQMMDSPHLFTNVVPGSINLNKKLALRWSSKWRGDVDTLESSVSVDQSRPRLVGPQAEYWHKG